MTDKKEKKKVSENSLKNLEKRKSFSKDNVEFSLECQRKGVEARKRNKIEREIIKEEIRNRFTMCDDIYKLIQENGGLEEVTLSAIHNCIENGNNRDLIKLLELIKPNEKQDLNITGDVGLKNTIINVIPIKGNENGSKS